MHSARETRLPYPGLRSFQANEADLFFGRERHSDSLLDILQREHFLAVIGPSGCGKSSLVRAGMLPAIRAGLLGTGSTWRLAVLRPGDAPFRRLADALVDVGVFGSELSAQSTISVAGDTRSSQPDTPVLASRRAEAELRRGPLGLIHLVENAKARSGQVGTNLLILVDQFEELFTYRTAQNEQENPAAAFVDLLLTSCATSRSRIHVVLTMRTDFLGHCVRFLNLPEAINRAQYLIPRLNREELTRAITDPAAVCGGRIEEALAGELVNAVWGTQDQLPLLQHALSRMWTLAIERDGDSPRITWADYHAAGGVEAALGLHADAVFGSLSADEQVAAEQLFRCITDRAVGAAGGDEVRRPQTLRQIARASGVKASTFVPVVRQFSAEGVNFLSATDVSRGDECVVDVAHEALIRQWSRLRTWVQQEAERAADYRRWRGRAVDYAERKGELLRGSDLVRAVEWRDGVRPAGADDERTGWRPTIEWAERYSFSARQAADEFMVVLSFIAVSEESERSRQEEERALGERHQRLERERLEALALASEAEARAQRERADAAGRLARLADERAREALAGRIATEALLHLDPDPDRGQLLAVLAYETAAAPATELVLRQAFVRGRGLRHVLRGHGDAVRTGSLSPDGRRAVTIGADRTMAVWDTGDGSRLFHLALPQLSEITSSAWSPDSTRLVIAIQQSGDDELRAFAGASGDALWSIAAPVRFHAVAFSRDGTAVIAAAGDGSIRWLDAVTGAPLQTVSGDDGPQHRGSVVSVEYSMDGTRLLTASFDGTARVWDAETGALRQILRAHQQPLCNAVFSPAGDLAATGSEDRTARVWSVASGDLLATLSGHELALSRVAFSPDAHRVLTTSHDWTARVWDVATGTLERILTGHEEAVLAGAFSPDGTRVATGSADESARLWDLATGGSLQLPGHDGGVAHVLFDPAGHYLLTGGLDGTARVWDTASGALRHVLQAGGEVTAVAVSTDGRLVATASRQGVVRVWEVAQGIMYRELAQHDRQVSRAVFAPDASLLLTTSYDRTAVVWEIGRGTPIAILRGHTDAVLDGCFAPDRRTVVTTSRSDDNSIRLWALPGGEARVFGAGVDEVPSALLTDPTAAEISPDGTCVVWLSDGGVAHLSRTRLERGVPSSFIAYLDKAVKARFSRDSTALVTTGDDGVVRVWRTAGGRMVGEVRLEDAAAVDAALTRNGESLVITTTDDAVVVAEPRSDTQTLESVMSPACDRWQLDAKLQVHTRETASRVSTVALGVSHDMVAAGTRSGMLHVWRAGEVPQVLAGHQDAVLHAVCGSEDRTVLTTSSDGTARLWNTAEGAPLATLKPDSGELRRVRISPDGSRILVIGQDPTATLWQMQDGRLEMALVGHEDAIADAAFVADGSRIVTGGRDGTVRVWEPSSGDIADGQRGVGRMVGFLGAADANTGIGAVQRATFSADSRTLVTVTDSGHVCLWDGGIGSLTHVWLGHDASIRDVRINPAGDFIATADEAGITRLWAVGSGAPLGALPVHSGAVVGVAFAFHLKGDLIATAGEDKKVRIVSTGGEVHRVFETGVRPKGIAISPNGTLIATVTAQDVRLWDIATGTLRHTLVGHGARIVQAVFSPDGARIATHGRDGTALLWSCQSGSQVAALRGHHDQPVQDVAFSPDGRFVASAGWDSSIALWRSLDGALARTLNGHSAPVEAIAFAPDGTRLASGSRDRTVRLWDVETGRPLAVLAAHGDGITDVAFGPDGATLVTVSCDVTCLWDASDGRLIARLDVETAPVSLLAQTRSVPAWVLTARGSTAEVWDVSTLTSIARPALAPELAMRSLARIGCGAISCDGRYVAAATTIGTITVWDMERATSVWTAAADATPAAAEGARSRVKVTDLTFSPTGELLAATTGQSHPASEAHATVCIWNVRTGDRVAVLKGHRHGISKLAFSQDDRCLASASDRTVRLWDPRTGVLLATLRGHTNSVTQVQFSGDGRTLVTAAADHQAILWDVATGTLLVSLRSHGGSVTDVAFSPDASRVVTASHDGTVRIWDVAVCLPAAELIGRIKTRIHDELTLEGRFEWGHSVRPNTPGPPRSAG